MNKTFFILYCLTIHLVGLSIDNFKDEQARQIFKKLLIKNDQEKTMDSLQIDNTKINCLDGFEQLKTLKNLSLKDNLITFIAPLLQLPHLKVLDLSHNQIKVPSNITSLKSLEQLDLSHNEIKWAFLCSFESLKNLNLNHNKLQQLIFVNNFNKRLESLDISHNPLNNIAFNHLPSLKNFKADNTFLKDLKGIENAQNLEVLSLENCIHLHSIKSLFIQLGDTYACRLPNLKKLIITDNFLDDESKKIMAHFRNTHSATSSKQTSIAPTKNKIYSPKQSIQKTPSPHI